MVVPLLIGACTQLRLERPLRQSGDDWGMYGGSGARANAASTVLVPPLSLAWEFDAGAGFGPSAAAVEDSVLFVSNLHGEVHAVDVLTGKQLGAHDFGASIFGTPIVDHEMLYVGLDDEDKTLLGYNLQTTAVEWQAKLGQTEASPLLLGDRLYVATLDGRLVNVNKNNGQVVWTFSLPEKARTTIVRSSPASDGKSVIFGSDCGTVYAVNIGDGKLRWSASARRSIIASPSIVGGKVYVGSLDSTFYCFDAETGKLLWSRPLGAKIYASQAVADGRVVVGCLGRTISCLGADDGRVLWSFEANGVVNAAPLISGGVVYTGCLGKTLYALDARNGAELWHYDTEGRIKTVPVIAKDRLFILAEDRSVLAFVPETGR